MKRLFLVICLLLFAPPVFGATYYVDSDGTNCSNPDNDYDVATATCGGGSETVYSTVAGAETAATTPGDHVYIRTGTYTENVTFNDDGAEDNYITFEACHDGSDGDCSDSDAYESVTIQFGGAGCVGATWVTGGATWLKFLGLVFKDSGDCSRALAISDASNIWFEDCTFQGGTYGALNITPGDNSKSATNITLKSCIFENGGGEGVYLSQDYSTNIITNVLFEDCIFRNNGAEHFESKSQTLNRQGPDQVTVRGCEIYGSNNGWAVFGFLKNTNFVFENNYMHDTSNSHYGGVSVSCRYSSSETSGYSTGVIRNNLFVDNSSDNDQTDAGAIRIQDCNNSHGSLIEAYNNTIYKQNNDNGISCTHVNFSTTVGGAIVKNNIIHSPADYQIYTASGDDCNADYNLRYGGSVDKTGANDQTGDPLFVSIVDGAENLSLQSDSPAIDNGTDLGDGSLYGLDPSSSWPGPTASNMDNYGSGWEIGAYVYASFPQVNGATIVGGTIK